MGCSCGGRSRSTTRVFQVKYKDGTTKDFLTSSEARTEVRKKGGTMRPVNKPAGSSAA